METFNQHEAALAQQALIKEKGFPKFPPTWGSCFSCGKNIYNKIGTTGISVEEASTNLITGCPHCHRSYCD